MSFFLLDQASQFMLIIPFFLSSLITLFDQTYTAKKKKKLFFHQCVYFLISHFEQTDENSLLSTSSCLTVFQ